MSKGINKVKISSVWIRKNGTNSLAISATGSDDKKDK